MFSVGGWQLPSMAAVVCGVPEQSEEEKISSSAVSVPTSPRLNGGVESHSPALLDAGWFSHVVDTGAPQFKVTLENVWRRGVVRVTHE